MIKLLGESGKNCKICLILKEETIIMSQSLCVMEMENKRLQNVIKIETDENTPTTFDNCLAL